MFDNCYVFVNKSRYVKLLGLILPCFAIFFEKIHDFVNFCGEIIDLSLLG